MNTKLESKILAVRAELESLPKSVLIGTIPLGTKVPDELTAFHDYREFVTLTNGAQCGEGIFHQIDRLGERSSFADYLDGGAHSWLVVGRFNHMGVVLYRSTQEVFLMDIGSDPMDQFRFSRLDEYLEFLFGTGYLILNGKYEDDWYQLLSRLGLLL